VKIRYKKSSDEGRSNPDYPGLYDNCDRNVHTGHHQGEGDISLLQSLKFVQTFGQLWCRKCTFTSGTEELIDPLKNM